MKRGTQLLILLGVLALLLAAAFLLLDFRLQRAQMAADSTVSTYSFSVDEESPLPLEQPLDLYVQAPLALEDELAEALVAELAANQYVRDVNLRQGSRRRAGDSVLVLTIEEPSVLFWSPFYARTVVNVTTAYASDGEVAWIEEDVVVMTSESTADPVVRVRGEYKFDGSSFGLISGPGYAHYLAEEVAQTVSQSLADSLTNHGMASRRGAQ